MLQEMELSALLFHLLHMLLYTTEGVTICGLDSSRRDGADRRRWRVVETADNIPFDQWVTRQVGELERSGLGRVTPSVV